MICKYCEELGRTCGRCAEREQLTAALARISALEAAARPVVEQLERVSLYGAADAYRETVERLWRVLEEKQS